FVPSGEGLGVSRRLEDDERIRLREIHKKLDLPKGGVIVRPAAEGASAEDIERDLLFLQRLWDEIQKHEHDVKAPSLVYQESELPLRVVRDREKEPLFERFGVDREIRSTLSRRVDLPSGGYLIFDYAEAFTVIDVNTGRFVGSRSKTSASRLEDTITKNNLEAVKEVVRQLRLRDIGGIIVIDFIDMANPKNRQAVEDALRNELERDRTKTYVVEISPLGLVEMTRQNVTEGPREILTRKCPTCGGDGVVISEQSAAIDLERRLRALAHGSRVQAFRIEVNASVAARLIGPGAVRLQEIEAASRRRFFLVPKEDVHFDHFLVAQQGKLEALAPQAPFEEGATIDLQPVQVGLHDSKSAVAKRDGYDIVVANGAGFVGKKVKAQITRVLPGTAYATIVKKTKDGAAPITAEGEAEKPTRKAAARKPASAKPDAVVGADTADAAESDAVKLDAVASDDDTAEASPKKKTRRGSRGGRKHKKAPTIHVPETELGANGAEPEPQLVAEEPAVAEQPVADETIAEEPEAQVAENGAGGDAPAADAGETPKKKTRRGSRGGRNRRKKPAAAAPAETTESS
ncbi:MAG: ribonuclease E/G, partial [Gaiellaceae bacterium]